MSKIKNFLSIVDRSSNAHEEPANFASGGGQEADASVQLINQLRDYILAPSIQMNEMRFMEMLNVIEDHRTAAERRLDKIDRHMTEAADKATIMTFNIENQGEDMRMLRQQVADELQAMRAQQEHFINEMRHSIDHSSRQLFDDLTRRAEAFEAATHTELSNMSNSLAGHISKQDLRWEEERQNTADTIQQLISQWRAERESVRREDMENLAGSMMDIGRRLMSAQTHA